MARMSVDERRRRLVEAAIAVMAREGVANTTTRGIVAEAGMQIGVFHYCFRSKEELVLEVMRAINERSYTAVGEVLAQPLEAADLIRAAVQAYWSHIAQNPLEHLLTYELTQYALRTPEAEHAAVEQYRNYTEGMVALITAMAQQGGFTWRTPAEVQAKFILAAIEGITFQWLVDRDDIAVQPLLEELGDYLVAKAGLSDPVQRA